MGNENDEQFVRVELPNAFRAIYVRASTNRALARKLVFDHLAYVGPDAHERHLEHEATSAGMANECDRVSFAHSKTIAKAAVNKPGTTKRI